MATSLDSNNNLVTLDAAKRFLGQSTANSSHDSRIRDQIDQVSHLFNSLTGRLLKKRTLTEYYDGEGGRTLLLRQYPIRSTSTGITVHVVSERTNYATDTDFSTAARVSSSDVDVRAKAGLVRIKGTSFWRGTANVKVVYEAGYDTTGASTGSERMPLDLEGAVLETIMYRWERQKQHRLGIQSISHDDGSATFSDFEMPLSAARVVNAYRSRENGYG